MSKKYDPNTYETVKSRKEKFYKDHADGRIVVEMIDTGKCMEYALFKASVYLTQEDQIKLCPRGVGYALEIRDKVLSTSNSGQSYESVNYTSWTENCEESAVGRALDNAGYSGNKKPSLEEIEKANRMAQTIQLNKPLSTTATEPTSLGKCSKCGSPNIRYSSGKIGCGKYCWRDKPLPVKTVEQ